MYVYAQREVHKLAGTPEEKRRLSARFDGSISNKKVPNHQDAPCQRLPRLLADSTSAERTRIASLCIHIERIEIFWNDARAKGAS